MKHFSCKKLLAILFTISLFIPNTTKIVIAKPRKKIVSKKKRSHKKRVKKFALNFNNVEIHEFLNIMGKLLKKNIVINDKVRGKISISSSRKIPVSQAFDVMKSILEVKGYAVVESRNLIKILPIKDAIKKNVEVIVDGKKSNYKKKTITFLLELKYADASKVANALKPLKSKNTNIIVYRPLNTILLNGFSKEINGLIEISKALDKEIVEETIDGGPEVVKGNIHVVNLENANSDQLAEVLSRIPFSDTIKIKTTPIKRNIVASKKSKRISGNLTKKKKQKLSIISNKETNSLIISATPDEYKAIKRIIDKLDIVREQVLIEALIVEINDENGWSFGIDWMLGGQTGMHMFGGSSINNGAPSYTTPSGLSGKTLALPAASGFQLGYLADNTILSYALLNAAGRDKKYNVLSTPQILTVDNHEAELNVAEEIPVPTNNRISDAGTQFFTFDYKSVGVKLKLTPHITKKKRITLDIYQEINSVLGETTVLDSGTMIPPTLGKRDIKTKVSVLDGKTIVIGGLIRNDKSTEEIGIPILSDIPLLGWIFKKKTVSYKKTNLLVFITPHIVTKQENIDRITQQKRRSQKRMR